ncbi:MAG: hypothetical protein Q9175_007382 [Cornicularia normoerica]
MSSPNNPAGTEPAWVKMSQDNDQTSLGANSSATDLQTPLQHIGSCQSQQQSLPESDVNVPAQNVPIPSSSDIPSGNIPNSQTPRLPTDREDVRLPLPKVRKIMKEALPPGANISTEAIQAMEACTLGFIQFVTEEAADNVSSTGRQLITGDHILLAMDFTGYENIAGALRPYLRGYRAAMDAERAESQRYTTARDAEAAMVPEGDKNA